MMKQIQDSHSKMAILALASVALLTPVVHGATITPNIGDVIVGFRAAANPGQTLNYEVDLGPVTQFYGLTPGQVVNFPGVSPVDLSATYGGSWITRTDLFWGAIATAGRASAYSNATLNVPAGTLWATVPNCGTAWNRGTTFAQKNASSAIETAFVAGSPLSGATSTANSTEGTVISASLAGSWTLQDQKTAGTSFGYFNPTIDNFEGTNVVASQVYELQPGSGAGTYLGDLYLDATGMHFRAAAPTAAICHSPVTILAGTNCLGTVTESQIDNGSTGYCLSLSISSGGPFAIGTTNVELIANSGSGQSSTCTATVIVQGAAPTLTNPGSISQCAPVVTYTLPVASGCNTPIGTVVCDHASGSTFPAGLTTVHCSAIDAASLTGTVSFAVNISGAAPTFTAPANISTNVTGSGTSMAISYTTPTGSGCATPVNVVCVPASGSTFNVGTSNVVCTATDALSQTTTHSFSVTVSGAGISGIEGQVSGIGTNTSPKLTTIRKNSLLNSLVVALKDLNHTHTNTHTGVITTNVTGACGQLNGFLLKVNVYKSLKIISTNDASALISAVNAEKTAIGCK